MHIRNCSAIAAVALVVGLAASAPAQALIAANGIAINGTRLNGLAMNGTRLNGLAMNGTRLNGIAINGTRLNGVVLPTDAQ
jgi:hypothetical protein